MSRPDATLEPALAALARNQLALADALDALEPALGYATAAEIGAFTNEVVRLSGDAEALAERLAGALVSAGGSIQAAIDGAGSERERSRLFALAGQLAGAMRRTRESRARIGTLVAQLAVVNAELLETTRALAAHGPVYDAAMGVRATTARSRLLDASV